jgi:mRNA interferase HigB
MQIIAKRRLQEFWAGHPRSEPALRVWIAQASKAEWTEPKDVEAMFSKGLDFIRDDRIIFDIGNEFRLIVHVAYAYRRVLIKFIGTHAELDRINSEIV